LGRCHVLPVTGFVRVEPQLISEFQEKLLPNLDIVPMALPLPLYYNYGISMRYIP